MATTSTPKPLPSRLADARRGKNLSQEQLAIRLGYSSVMIGKCEQGSRRPSKPLLRRWAAVTGKPISWFYAENGEGREVA